MRVHGLQYKIHRVVQRRHCVCSSITARLEYLQILRLYSNVVVVVVVVVRVRSVYGVRLK